MTDGPSSQNLSKQQVEMIIARFRERGVTQPCSRCGNVNFTVQDSLIVNALQGSLREATFSGMTMPTVATICDRCGCVSNHALGTLGLMNDEFEDARNA